MAKKRTSFVEDLLDVTAMMPWWVGISLAVVSYVFLHGVATSEVAPPTTAAQMAPFITQSLPKIFANIGQILLPPIFLVGAALSQWRRRSRRQLFADVEKSASAAILNGMSWQEFEMLVGEAFREQGFTVIETGGGGADGGVDLFLTKDGETFFVQCKQWKAFQVGVGVVRELYGVMAAKGATGGYAVTSGKFTAEASEFASGRNIVLLDGAALHALIGGVKRPVEAKCGRMAQDTSLDGDHNGVANCPKCGGAMAKRTATRGPNAGKAFWGCLRFPACKGIREI